MVIPTGYYRSVGGVFPLRWSAPEALTTMKFTTASDVWSFGIVLVEVFQIGVIPYKNLNNEQVIRAVVGGDRVRRPAGCRPNIWAMMTRCWASDVTQRPTFADLATYFAGVADTHDDLDIKDISFGADEAPPLPPGGFEDAAGYTGQEAAAHAYKSFGEIGGDSKTDNTLPKNATLSAEDPYIGNERTGGAPNVLEPEQADTGGTGGTDAGSSGTQLDGFVMNPAFEVNLERASEVTDNNGYLKPSKSTRAGPGKQGGKGKQGGQGAAPAAPAAPAVADGGKADGGKAQSYVEFNQARAAAEKKNPTLYATTSTDAANAAQFQMVGKAAAVGGADAVTQQPSLTL